MKIYDLELRQKFVREETMADPIFSTPAAQVSYICDAFKAYPCRESAWIIPLTLRGRPMGRHLVSVGSLNTAWAGAREVFRAAIIAGAASIIVAHNHTSGDPAPSRADRDVAHDLRNAGSILGIHLKDFLIVGTPEEDPLGIGYFSFFKAGLV